MLMSDEREILAPFGGAPSQATSADLRRILTALGAGIRHGAERDLPSIFEHELRQLLAIRGVRLREVPARYQARLVTPTRTAGSIVLDVPTSDPRMQAVLEASTDPARSLNEGDLDLLDAAAQLGGLVLEAGRVKPLTAHQLRDGAAPLIGSSPGMEALRLRVERVATTDFTALIEGESGTGKELVARQIHDLSRRRRGPFVAVNCAAVVETLLEAELFGIEDRTATGVRGRRGKFEHSDMGTLFLDEVSDLSLSAQAKLLRAVQDLSVERVGGTGSKRVNTRIVAATNRPLSGLVEKGLFHADLYYRLSGVEIHEPPPRERRADVTKLTRVWRSSTARCSPRSTARDRDAALLQRVRAAAGSVLPVLRCHLALHQRCVGWLDTDRFDIVAQAKATCHTRRAADLRDQRSSWLQRLLAVRFGGAVHTEARRLGNSGSRAPIAVHRAGRTARTQASTAAGADRRARDRPRHAAHRELIACLRRNRS